MDANTLIPITGIIERIDWRQGDCRESMVFLSTPDGPANIMLMPETYVVDNVQIRSGMGITAFYDMLKPVPLIYPPRYQALFIALTRNNEFVTIRHFDRNLMATDGSLKLNVAPSTDVTTANGQRYHCHLGNQPLMVFYSRTTRSLPPQTTPRRIIVF